MPPGVTADWNRYAYRFYNDAQYCAGLASVARVLANCRECASTCPGGRGSGVSTRLLRAYHWTQRELPVLWLGDGTWGPAEPALLDSLGRCEEFLPGEDGNQAGPTASRLARTISAALGICTRIQPKSRPCPAPGGLSVSSLGHGRVSRADESARPVQLRRLRQGPAVDARVAEVYALRDEVKPFVRSRLWVPAAGQSREPLGSGSIFTTRGAGTRRTRPAGSFARPG